MVLEASTCSALAQLWEHLPVGLILTDAEHRVAYVNAALAQWMAVDPDDWTGRRMTELDVPALAALAQGSTHVRLTESSALMHTVQQVDLGDRFANIGTAYALIPQVPAGTAEGLLSLRRELGRHGLTEVDTGLLSQPALMLLLESEVSRSRRYHNPLSVVILQIDGVREGADPALQISQVLKDQLRWADLVARDELGNFVLVLPETTGEAASTLTEKIALSLKAIGQEFNYCFGVAEWTKADSAFGLLHRARAQRDADQGEHPANHAAS